MTRPSLFQWKSYRTLMPLVVFVVAISVGLLAPTPARALIFDTLASIVGYIVLLIVSVLGKLITVVIAILIKISAYNDFINAPAVTVGWSVLRDLANMVVVVFLLVIALSTILSAPSYEYKQLLPRLLVMAVVVNFSKTIVGIMIDASQIVMLTFVSAFAEAGAGNFVTALNLEKMLALNPEVSQSVSSANIFAGIFLALILMVIALVVLVIMTIIIAFRIIMLWILTVLSPLVFILSALQTAKKYYDQWWQQLTNYLIVGPVLAFFIWLTLVSAGGTPGGDSRSVQTFAGDAGSEEAISYFAKPEDQAFITQAGHTSQLIGFLVAIGMLLGGLMITQQLGVVGSGLAGGALSAGKQYASAALKGGGKLMTGAMKVPFTYGIRKWNEKGYVNPAAMYRGWQASRKQKIDDARGKADAIGREKMERLLSTRLAKDAQGKWKLQKGLAMPHEAAHRASLEARAMKEMDGVPAEKLFKTVEQLYGRKDEDSQTKMRGALRILARDGKIDDLHGTAFIKGDPKRGIEPVKWTDEEGVAQTGFGNYGRTNGRQMMLALMGAGNAKAAMGSDAVVETLDRIGADSEKIGRRELAHLTKFDDEIGKNKVQTEADASDHEMKELGKMPLEKAMEIKPHATAKHTEDGRRFAPVLDEDRDTNEARAFATTVDKGARSGEKAVIRRMDGRYKEMVTGTFDQDQNAYVITNDDQSRRTAAKVVTDHGDFLRAVEWQNKGAKVVEQNADGTTTEHADWSAYAKAKGIKYKYSEPGSKSADASPLNKKTQDDVVREFTDEIRKKMTAETTAEEVQDVITVKLETLQGTKHEEKIPEIRLAIEKQKRRFVERRRTLKIRQKAVETRAAQKQAKVIADAVKAGVDASKKPPEPELPKIIIAK